MDVSSLVKKVFSLARLRFLLTMICIVTSMCAMSYAQTYPRWFLEPMKLTGTAAGYTQNFYLQTSSDSAAFLRGCENLARQRYTEFEGGEAYWQTEAGVYWMGDNFTEKIDSTFLMESLSHAKKIASYTTKDMTYVLVSGGEFTVPDSLKSIVKCPSKEPTWVEAIPQSDSYVFGLGVAPKYFYESSSWESAEKKARFNLARNMKVSLETMQKVSDQSGQEIRNEELSETLHDIEVVYRWQDVSRGLFYVLMRTQNK